MRTTIQVIALGFLCSVAQVSAADIDFKLINKVFAEVSDEIVKAEPIKNKAGVSLLSALSLKFAEDSDIEKDKFGLSAEVGLKASPWSSAGSVLTASAKAERAASPADATKEVMNVAASLDLQTDLPALVGYVYNRMAAVDDPCSETNITSHTNALEEKFHRDACVELPKLATLKDSEAFLDVITAVISQRLVFVDAATKELEPLPAGTTSPYAEEKKWLTLVKGQLDKRLDKGASAGTATVSIEEDVTVADGFTLSALSVTVKPDGLAVTLRQVYPGDAPEIVQTRDQIKAFARDLSLAPDQQARIDRVQQIQVTLAIIIDLAKSAIAEE